MDLSTSDPDRATAFYRRVFGWEATDPAPEFGGYFTFTLDGVPVAGCMAAQEGAGQPDRWLVHLASPDVAATLAQAASAGGTVDFGPHPVGDLGYMSMVRDPAGNGVGVWQPGTFEGTGVFFEASAPSWFELRTDDYDAVVAFYRTVFGWDTVTMADSPEFRYTTLREPGSEGMVAGVLDAGTVPDGAPAGWSFYLWSNDLPATLETVAAAGGSVVMGAHDTPYGAMATVTDPLGARLHLQAANDQMPAGTRAAAQGQADR
jgi:predicted enzyme related to lactoylglutathione lyase